MSDKRDGTASTWRGRIESYVDPLTERVRWRRVEPEEGPEIGLSGPLSGCRPASVGEVPLGAQRLAERAAGAGWSGTVTRSLGWRNARRGRPSRVQRVTVESIAVRMRHPSGWRAVAVWENGATAGAWLWLPGGVLPYGWPRNVGVTVVSEWIEARGRLTIEQAIEVSKRES